jgi:lysophospholipase L1-like esterase
MTSPITSPRTSRITWPITLPLGAVRWGGGGGLPIFSTAVAIGDSITQGLNASVQANAWVNLIASDRGVTILNKGISGTVLQNSNYTGGVPLANNGRDRFITDMTGSNKRDFAFIGFGTNDARFLLFPATFNVTAFKNDAGEMITGLVENGYALNQICILTPHWIPDDANFGSGGNRASYELYVTAAQDIAQEYGIYFCNTYTYMRDHGGAALIDTDKLHPIDAGHRVIATAIETTSAILNALPGPSALAYAASNGQIDVSYVAPAGTITNYTVQLGLDSTYGFTSTQDVSGLSASFTSLAAGTYRARVRANFADGTHSPWIVASTSKTIAAADGSFMLDTFTDADGTDITSHTGEAGATWSLITGYAPATPSKITSNRLYTTTAQGGYKASGTPPTADYYVEGVVRYLTNLASDSVGIAGRIDPAANTMYFGRYGNTAGGWQLFKVIAGAATQLGSTVTASFPTGLDKTLRLVMQGTTIKLLVDGVEVISATDSAISTAGFAGVRMTTTQTTTTGAHVASITAVVM